MVFCCGCGLFDVGFWIAFVVCLVAAVFWCCCDMVVICSSSDACAVLCLCVVNVCVLWFGGLWLLSMVG